MITKPVVFFGTEAFSAVTLDALITTGFTIAAIVTKPDRAHGRGRRAELLPVKALALKHHIPLLQPESFDDDALTQLRILGVTAGVVVAYGKILPQRVIDLFNDGLINTHASLLPRYRGASPIEQAIYNGDAKTGVTLMRIEAGLDSGPTYAVAEYVLSGTETKPKLYEALAKLGANLLVTKLPSILDGSLTSVPQDATQVTLAGMIAKADGALDCSRSAVELDRQVRAYLGWPGSRLTINEDVLIVTAAHPGDSEPFVNADGNGATPGTPFLTTGGNLAVVTGHGELILDRVKPAGKQEMTGSAYVAGHPLR